MAIKYSPETEAAKLYYLSIIRRQKIERTDALKKWSDAAIEDSKKATTLEEAENAFRAAPRGTPAKKIALEKWTILSATTKDLEKVLKASWSLFSIVENPAWEKWELISKEQAEKATNLKQIEEVFLASAEDLIRFLGNTTARAIAFKKWMTLCTTLEEVDRAEKVAKTSCIPVLRKMYCDRYDELYFQIHGKSHRWPQLSDVL